MQGINLAGKDLLQEEAHKTDLGLDFRVDLTGGGTERWSSIVERDPPSRPHITRNNVVVSIFFQLHP